MIFAFWHALLGWSLALLLCCTLRRHSASARCWAWRLGLLKGPLALVMVVPIFVAAPLPVAPAPPSPIPAPPVQTGGIYEADRPYRQPLDLFPLLYGAGVVAVALARLAAMRRVHREMPRVEGVLRPRVVVPEGLPPEAAAMALAHETAHVRRRDPQWSFVADLVCAALWFAPPVWLCARAMRAESEAACDAATLRETGASKGAYARLLLAFAGPAPANALGGPARRLARRILMLNQTVKPLPRPAWALLVFVGLAAALPWNAVAGEERRDEPVADRLPARTSLQPASLRLLREPEVRAALGLSRAQEETLALGTYRGNLRLLAQRKRDAISNLRKYPSGSRDPMAQATRVELTNVTRDEAETRQKIERTRFAPLSEAQRRKLASLALDRFGSALWEDPAVAAALGLSPEQIAGVLAQNDAIETALRNDRSAGEFAYWVSQLESESRQVGLAPARKREIERRIRETRAMADRFRPIRQEVEPRFWRMRGAADARLEATLDERQRKTLTELKTRPETWKGNLTSMQFYPEAGRAKNIRDQEGSTWKVYRTGEKPPYGYSVDRASRP